jgi:hypothetical protein
MAVQQHRSIQDIPAPQPHHHVTERHRGIGQPACLGAGSRAKQAQPEDGTPVRVDAPGRGKHRSFGFKTDDPETPCKKQEIQLLCSCYLDSLFGIRVRAAPTAIQELQWVLFIFAIETCALA